MTRQTVLLVFHDVLLVEIEQAGAVAPHVRGRLHDGEWMSGRSQVTAGHVPPIIQPSFLVQKHDVWVIEVRRRGGTVQSIEQGAPTLFQAGLGPSGEGPRSSARLSNDP